MRRWERHFEKIRPSLPAALVRHPRFREQFLAGEWLGEQLLARQIPPDQASDICFAHGQVCAQKGGDPWAHARQALADTEAGNPPVPGPGLAERLLKEAGLFGDVDGLLEFLLDQGFTPQEMDEMVDGFRENPRYPPRAVVEDHHAPLFAALAAHKLPNLVVDRMVMTYRRRWHDRRNLRGPAPIDEL